MPGDLTAIRMVANGHVQGVGFRAFVQAVCRAHHLVGWVRNRDDGSVEAQIFGDSKSIDAALARIRSSRANQIRRLDVEALPAPITDLTEFEIRA